MQEEAGECMQEEAGECMPACTMAGCTAGSAARDNGSIRPLQSLPQLADDHQAARTAATQPACVNQMGLTWRGRVGTGWRSRRRVETARRLAKGRLCPGVPGVLPWLPRRRRIGTRLLPRWRRVSARLLPRWRRVCAWLLPWRGIGTWLLAGRRRVCPGMLAVSPRRVIAAWRRTVRLLCLLIIARMTRHCTRSVIAGR